MLIEDANHSNNEQDSVAWLNLSSTAEQPVN